jgi:hypothetical protein
MDEVREREARGLKGRGCRRAPQEDPSSLSRRNAIAPLAPRTNTLHRHTCKARAPTHLVRPSGSTLTATKQRPREEQQQRSVDRAREPLLCSRPPLARAATMSLAFDEYGRPFIILRVRVCARPFKAWAGVARASKRERAREQPQEQQGRRNTLANLRLRSLSAPRGPPLPPRARTAP